MSQKPGSTDPASASPARARTVLTEKQFLILDKARRLDREGRGVIRLDDKLEAAWPKYGKTVYRMLQVLGLLTPAGERTVVDHDTEIIIARSATQAQRLRRQHS